ncbi:glycosyl transferase [Pseudonocardia sulfidoxydans NBRC 16205]|uniref:Glycosyl transferase n=1 Tax=Pseudonocardia sulfidoxydans NBRC 16205 TaxID=1223511 RepID=A0A511DF36_9PSEU|nr:glycosyltransferase [Pseudonocardia sulfidoxydans]GEL23400.1 glycosyl transferase [Pseudonocardia sulfidoxydans NBRC 16205]
MSRAHLPVRGVAVVVPAHDEQTLIGPCLDALAVSVDAVARDDLGVVVTVVLDRCTDGTADVVRDTVRRRFRPGTVATLVSGTPRTVGELRTLGLDDGFRRLGCAADRTVPTDRVWLLSTDADTRVPPTWIRDHLRLADAGADAVVGLVDLDGFHELPTDVQCRYTAIVDAGTTVDAHTHAYAANLGVRADAFVAAGGFPVVAAGEEHALLAQLRAAGRRVATPLDLCVHTSARTRGRAAGGLADLLRDLARVGGVRAEPG